MSIQSWIEGLVEDAVKAAVDAAVDDMKDDIITEIQSIETSLTTQITSLPGLLGAQIQNVVVDTGAVASKVLTGLASLPQQIIQGVIGGLNPFKGQL